MKQKLILLAISLFASSAIISQCDNLRKPSSYARNANARVWENNEFGITEDKPSQSGSVWYSNPLNLDGDFALEFEIYLGNKDGGADGLAFVLQRSSQGTSALSTGGGIGYKDISPSIAVEYDTWENGNYKDPYYDHISIMKNGSVTHDASQPGTAYNMISNMEDGKFHKTKITWQASSKTLKVFWEGKQILSQKIDMKAAVFNNDAGVYWGWTGATGAAFNEQKIKVVSTTFLEMIYAQANVTPSACNTSGAIDLTITGGIPPYSFLWSNGSVTEDIDGLAPGTYSVTVTDACKNWTTGNFTVIASAGGTPTLKCPNDMVLDNTPGQCAAVNVTYEQPVVLNSCAPSRISQTAGLPSGSTFQMGTTLNTFSVTLPNGSTQTCSFNVTVK